MLFHIVLGIFVNIWNCEAYVSKANETDLSKCKVHYSHSEGTYRQFFQLSENSHRNGSDLDFHFAVLAASDAHILLSPSATVDKNDPVYEIVLGAGGNTFSDIRRKQKSSVRASLRKKFLLSALDVKFFWIHVSKDGAIGIGNEGEELAFLEWVDPDPLPLKYFSFCTWAGVEAKWFYDCIRPNENSDNSSSSDYDSKEVERPLSDLERIRKDLLFHYDSNVRPVYDNADVLEISTGLRIHNIELDEKKSILNLSGKMQLSWFDEKLRWNSSDYGNISEIHIFHREIWLPDLVLLNAVGTGTDILQSYLIVVNEYGFVQWRPVVNIKAWCDASKLGHWPSDIHNCDIVLGFWTQLLNTYMYFNASGLFDYKMNREWEILSIKATSANMGNTVWAEYFKNVAPEIETVIHPALKITFEMKRIGSGYYAILFAPFLFISVTMLSVFWVSPFGYYKITLGCLQLILTSMILAALGIIMPAHPTSVPYIVLLYNICLVLGIISVLFSIFIINLSRNEQSQGFPHFLHVILTREIVKRILFLPNTKLTKSYGKLETISPEKQENIQDMWVLLGISMDRVLFIIYLIFIVFAIIY